MSTISVTEWIGQIAVLRWNAILLDNKYTTRFDQTVTFSNQEKFMIRTLEHTLLQSDVYIYHLYI